MLSQRTLFIILFLGLSASADKPSWFDKDSKSSEGWSFYCTSDGKSETESEQSARSQCSQKICMLFGVEVTAETKSTETLKDSNVTNTVIEKCPNVKVVGRVEKKKSTECSDGVCQTHVFQFYPKHEYDKEFKRLNQPAIVKEFEKTIVIREGNQTFKDPTKCKAVLKEYASVRGELESAAKNRIEFLTTAQTECAGLDYRNIPLRTELMGYLTSVYAFRSAMMSTIMGQSLMKGGELATLINDYLDLEKRNQQGKKKKSAAEALIKKNYDWLYYRDNYQSESNEYGWKLQTGEIVKESPVVVETKTCAKHAKVLLEWPENVFDDINVCVPKPSNGEDCQQVSVLLLKYSYIGCVCTAGSKDQAGCTKSLIQFLNDECPQFVTKACFQKLSKFAAETMHLSNIK